MDMQKNLQADEILTREAVAQKVALSGINGISNMLAQQEGNKHMRMQVAFQGGALMETVTHKGALSATANFVSGWMGMLAAATAPTQEKLHKLEQRLDIKAAIPVAMPPQRSTVKVGINYTAPKNGL